MERLLFLDFLRGLLIVVMITYHAVVYCVFEGIQNALDIIPSTIMPFLLPLLLLLTWAALFALLSGIAKSYRSYSQVIHEGETVNTILKETLWRGGFIIMLHFLYLGVIGHFQRNLADEPVRSLLVGSLEVGYWRWLDVEILFFVDALLMTSTSGIFVGILLWVLWRKNGIKKSQRNMLILGGLGISWLFLSPLAHTLLDPIFLDWMEKNYYVRSFFLSIFVGPRHCLFPYFSFALFGAIFGILLAENPRDRATRIKIRWFGYGASTFFLIIAGLWILIAGMPALTTAILPFPMYTLNLGLMLALTTILIEFLEFPRTNPTRRLLRRTMFFRRFGLVTLSVYMLESILSLVLAKLGRLLFPLSFSSNVFVILGYLAINLVCWIGILSLWERIQFKFSMEWWTDQFLRIICHHHSHRLELQSSLYLLPSSPHEQFYDSSPP
jgi:hypothetical protein